MLVSHWMAAGWIYLGWQAPASPRWKVLLGLCPTSGGVLVRNCISLGTGARERKGNQVYQPQLLVGQLVLTSENISLLDSKVALIICYLKLGQETCFLFIIKSSKYCDITEMVYLMLDCTNEL